MTSSDQDPPFSHFVEFTVDPLHVENLMAVLISRVERFTSQCAGFISAGIYVSDDGERALMHLLWSSRSHAEQALERAQQHEPDLVQLAREYHAKALTFSTFSVVSQVHAE